MIVSGSLLKYLNKDKQKTVIPLFAVLFISGLLLFNYSSAFCFQEDIEINDETITQAIESDLEVNEEVSAHLIDVNTHDGIENGKA